MAGSHRLMHWAREFILSMAPGSGIGGEGEASPPPPKPHEVLMAAWEYTIGEKVREAAASLVSPALPPWRIDPVLCWLAASPQLKLAALAGTHFVVFSISFRNVFFS